MPDVIDRNYESDIINEKYDFIEEIIREVLVNKDRQDALTEKADRVLTHKFWSIPIFLVVMAAVFFLTFTIGDWLKGFLELGIESLSALISDGLIAVGVNEVLRSLLVDGIIAGVGGILTFLPNIFILFLALAFLEDSGYMARVAYVMEGIMSKLGLSGRAFIPMILGFGCTVPAIMASRSLENRRDRFKVMLITPFMSCSARLPIYILFAEMFFQERAMLVAYSMYLIGLVVAILVAAIIHLIDRRKSENYLLIELPEYKAPSARTVAIYVWEKVKDYLTKAGTTIFVASILMWVILNFGPHGYTTEMADSFGSILGHWLVPIFAPIGLGFWQIAVALIAGISAKEVVVSSCAVLFRITKDHCPPQEQTIFEWFDLMRNPTDALSRPDLEINLEHHRVFKHGTEVYMSRYEYGVLSLMAQHPGKLFTKEQIFEAVWHKDSESYLRAVISTIGRIRQKIEDDKDHPRYIKTVSNIGYQFVPSSESVRSNRNL